MARAPVQRYAPLVDGEEYSAQEVARIFRTTERTRPVRGRKSTAYEYTSHVTDEVSVLDEAIANLREAVQRICATQNVMHARGMTEEVSYWELLTRLSNKALAMAEAA